MAEEKKSSQVFQKILIGLFYLFVFFFLLQNSFSYLDPDFGWHLKMGEQISETRAVPTVNYEDYTLIGQSWVDFEWLMNLTTYHIYHNFGYIVLSVFFALIIIAALFIQLAFARKKFLAGGRGLFIFLVLQLLGLYAALPHLGVRMQEISVICLLIQIILIESYSRNKNYKILFWLPPLFIFWASAHAGFLLGLGLLGFFVFIKAVELFTAKRFSWEFLDRGKILTFKQIAVFAIFSFLALAATFATPYGWRLYGYLFGSLESFSQTHISEWQGQWFFPFIYPQLIFLEIALLYLTLVFFAAFIFRGEHRRKIDLWSVSLVGLFSLLAFKARRHFPLFFIVSLPILAGFFSNFFVGRSVFWPRLKPGLKFSRLLGLFIVAAFLAAAAAMAVRIDFTARPETHYADEYPVAAIGFLRSHPEWNDRRIFNDYGWGGFLIWQYPERQLFIDGRFPQINFHGQTLLQEYFAFFDKDKAAAKLKENDIGLVLLKKNKGAPKIRWWEKYIFGIREQDLAEADKNKSALSDYLHSAPEWLEVYNDGPAEIFVKK